MRTKLRAARDRAGLRQQDVAERLGITQSAYSRIEAGAPTTTTVIEALAKLLGVSTGDAMENAGAPPVPGPTEDSGEHPLPAAPPADPTGTEGA